MSQTIYNLIFSLQTLTAIKTNYQRKSLQTIQDPQNDSKPHRMIYVKVEGS